MMRRSLIALLAAALSIACQLTGPASARTHKRLHAKTVQCHSHETVQESIHSLFAEAAAAELKGDVISCTPQLTASNVYAGIAPGVRCKTYGGMHRWGGGSVLDDLWGNVSQSVGKWISEFIDGWIADSVNALSATIFIIERCPASICAKFMCQRAVNDVLMCLTAGVFAFSIVRQRNLWNSCPADTTRRVLVAVAALLSAILIGYLLPTYCTPVCGIHASMGALWASTIRSGLSAGAIACGNLMSCLGFVEPLTAFEAFFCEVIAISALIEFALIGIVTVAALSFVVVTKCVQTAMLCLDVLAQSLMRTHDLNWSELARSYFVCVWLDVVWVVSLHCLMLMLEGDSNPWLKAVVGLLVAWAGARIAFKQCLIIWRRSGLNAKINSSRSRAR